MPLQDPVESFLDKVDWGNVPPPASWDQATAGNFEDAEEDDKAGEGRP